MNPSSCFVFFLLENIFKDECFWTCRSPFCESVFFGFWRISSTEFHVVYQVTQMSKDTWFYVKMQKQAWNAVTSSCIALVHILFELGSDLETERGEYIQYTKYFSSFDSTIKIYSNRVHPHFTVITTTYFSITAVTTFLCARLWGIIAFIFSYAS